MVLIPDPLATPIEGYLFESPELPNHWAGLDEFESAGYGRGLTPVRTAEGDMSAWIYVIAGDHDSCMWYEIILPH
jgi:gamma-glutamylcyclotransferase (GGCT)/AIG2-like uncharacterized protein YtfP